MPSIMLADLSACACRWHASLAAGRIRLYADEIIDRRIKKAWPSSLQVGIWHVNQMGRRQCLAWPASAIEHVGPHMGAPEISATTMNAGIEGHRGRRASMLGINNWRDSIGACRASPIVSNRLTRRSHICEAFSAAKMLPRSSEIVASSWLATFCLCIAWAAAAS